MDTRKSIICGLCLIGGAVVAGTIIKVARDETVRAKARAILEDASSLAELVVQRASDAKEDVCTCMVGGHIESFKK